MVQIRQVQTFRTERQPAARAAVTTGPPPDKVSNRAFALLSQASSLRGSRTATSHLLSTDPAAMNLKNTDFYETKNYLNFPDASVMKNMGIFDVFDNDYSALHYLYCSHQEL